jgi:hypothetical protein
MPPFAPRGPDATSTRRARFLPTRIPTRWPDNSETRTSSPTLRPTSALLLDEVERLQERERKLLEQNLAMMRVIAQRQETK